MTSIGENAFYNSACYILFNNPIPYTTNIFNTSTVYYVPDDAVGAYREAWPDYAAQFIPKSSYDVLTDVHIETVSETSSALAEYLGENNLLNVTKLKLSGKINSYDMMVIRNKMVNLRELDMENVDIVANDYEYYQGCHSEVQIFFVSTESKQYKK